MSWEDLSESEKGYIAGFLDGEGSISMSKSGEGHYVTVCFYNTHLPTMNWIAESLGFKNITRTEDKRKDERHTKNNYVVQIRKASLCLSLLKSIEPYLMIKKEQAQLIINFLEWQLDRESFYYTECDKDKMEQTKIKLSTLNVVGD